MTALAMKQYPASEDRRLPENREKREEHQREHGKKDSNGGGTAQKYAFWAITFLVMTMLSWLVTDIREIKQDVKAGERRAGEMEKRFEIFLARQEEIARQATGNAELLRDEIAARLSGENEEAPARPRRAASRSRVARIAPGRSAPPLVAICHYGPVEGSDEMTMWPLRIPPAELKEHLTELGGNHVNDYRGPCR